jgi:signal transduction histidine kinase
MNAAVRTLRRILSERVLTIAFIALILQFAYTAYEYSRSSNDLAETAIEKELSGLTVALQSNPRNFVLPEDLAGKYTKYPGNYGFEIRAADNQVIVSANPGLFADLMQKEVKNDREVSVRDRVASVPRVFESHWVTVGDVNYVMSATAIGDPAGLVAAAFTSELLDHVILPIVPLTLFLLAGLWLVLTRSLSPIEAAVDAFRRVDPAEGGARLDLHGAPLEIAVLGQAVNRSLDRLDEALKSHRDFAANVAHELRTPLSLIMLELEDSPDPSAKKVRAEAQSMSHLINQLLSISRLEGLDRSTFTAVDLSALARGVAAQLAPAALKSGIELEVVEHEKIAVKAQAEAIESALRNLVENAARVAPPGTSVVLAIGPGPTLSVTDKGPGIAKERLSQLFERYRQGDRRTRGSAGLGLEITKRTIELHGGRIEVKSLDMVQRSRWYFLRDFFATVLWRRSWGCF